MVLVESVQFQHTRMMREKIVLDLVCQPLNLLNVEQVKLHLMMDHVENVPLQLNQINWAKLALVNILITSCCISIIL